jgi:glucose-6-phosphate isomerase
MKPLQFSFVHSGITKKQLTKEGKKLQKEIVAMKKAAQAKYKDDRASINLHNDRKSLQKVQALISSKLRLKPEYVVVIGIGGSNLGTIAVQEAVRGKLYDQKYNSKIKILYADTVDTDTLHAITTIIEPTLQEGNNVILNVVTKSGGTTETIANFQVLLTLLKKYKKKDYKNYVVVTSGRDSKLWKVAVQEKFSVLEIPEKVGGRYSVFSPVGLFPLGLIGVNITQLLKGAGDMKKACLNPVQKNPAAVSALIQYAHYKKGRNISDLFLFASDLESVGKWYRQLMGESIGKEKNRNGKRVWEGITPTVSVGSTDLHSMAQLYLGGPQDKITTFVHARHMNSNVTVPKLDTYEHLIENIQGKSLPDLMDAILQGVQIAFNKGKRPYIEIALPDKSEHSIAQFLQFKMMEIMYLGYLLNVNPFDQPNVEAYKTETKKILGSKT